nr:MAG TPA: hypothetical protein [Caudoviricetes sp.]
MWKNTCFSRKVKYNKVKCYSLPAITLLTKIKPSPKGLYFFYFKNEKKLT